MRGRKRSGIGEGNSALNRSIPPTPSLGKMATDRTIKPVPPSHCSKLRQSKMPWGCPGTSVMTVAPVVVTPDIALKNASIEPGTVAPKVPAKTKGSPPNRYRKPAERNNGEGVAFADNFRQAEHDDPVPGPNDRIAAGNFGD